MGPLRLISEKASDVEGSLDDIKGTLRSSEATMESSQDLSLEISGLKPVFKTLGPIYKDRMSSIVSVLKNPARSVDMANELETKGSISFDPGDGGGEVELSSDMVEIEREWRFKGRHVEHITVGDTIVVLEDL